MNQRQNIYNNPQMPPFQPQMGQGMIPPPMRPVPPMQRPTNYRGRWQQRAMNAANRAKSAFPNWLAQYAIGVYIVALAVVSMMYASYSLPWYFMLSGVIGVVVVFMVGKHLTSQLSLERVRSQRNFERRLFLTAFLLRAGWMLLIYTIFMQSYGDAFGFENQDAKYYDDMGNFVSGIIRNGNFNFYDEIAAWSGNEDISDMGYGTYVGIVYALTGNSIIALRLLKCVWSALTVLLLYRLAIRNFGTKTARIAAILCALWPNFWYYSGCHLKETEMVLLTVLFVEQADQMLRSRQFTAWKLVPILLVAAAMLTFRTVLGLVALLALVTAVVMSSSRVVSWGKRVIIGFLAILFVGVTVGNRLQERATKLVEQVQRGDQDTANEWRTRRENGNAFAKYAGASVFAPMIFTIPFPTMVRPFDGQNVQQLLNGGNFVKNVLSFFTIMALITLLLSGKWREHLLPVAFVLGYVLVLTMSSFAHSERFHQPAMPLEFMFIAYGISIAVTKLKYKRWFTYWSVLMFIAAIAWNWFKMAGRGMA